MVQKRFVQSTQEAFERYLREGALCYASGIKYSPKEVIDQIHKSRGKAVLAHPHFIKKGTFLRKLLSLSFDGLECYLVPTLKDLVDHLVGEESNVVQSMSAPFLYKDLETGSDFADVKGQAAAKRALLIAAAG